MTIMEIERRNKIANGFKVLADHLGEHSQQISRERWQVLEILLSEAWSKIDRRTTSERRG